MKKKVYTFFMLIVSLIILTACSKSADGNYQYQGDLPLITNVTINLQIKGDKGQVQIKGNSMGFVPFDKTEDIVVDQKEKTIMVDSSMLGYELKDGNLTITTDASGVFTGKIFQKQKQK